MGQSVCPRCGSGADVRTVAELFNMLNGAQDGAMQQARLRQQTGPDYQGTYPDYPAQGYQGPSQGYQGPSQGYQGPDSAGTNPDSAGTNQDHPYESYQGPGIPTAGQGPAPGYQGPDYPSYQGPDYPNNQGPDYPNNRRSRPTIDSAFGLGDDPVQDIAGAVLGAAFKFGGRGIGKRIQRAYEERIGPALEARAAQARQQSQQSRDEQAAIVERYPDLRGCLRDQVVFLDGGSRSVPITEIRMPVTLAQADALVNRLRAG
jgi:hypothetical protein